MPIAEVRLNERKLRPSRKGRHEATKLGQQHQKQPEPQFATLQELFRHKFGPKQQLMARLSGDQTDQSSNLENENHNNEQQQNLNRFKTKIPVMKLSKDDWNVKCWEDRLKPVYLRTPSDHKDASSGGDRVVSKRASSLEEPDNSATGKQIEIFNQRIDDVSMKLDKIRVGQPMDEKLHELTTNKFKRKEQTIDISERQQARKHAHATHRVARETHGWIELLKSEIQNGVHNPKILSSELASKIAPPSQEPKSVLGRPIRRIYEDDEDDDNGAC